MTTVPSTVIQTVADEVLKVFGTISSHDSDTRDARSVMQDASEKAGNARETALVALANLASVGKWSKYDIDEGVGKALEKRAAGRNDKETTIATFASEIKIACHPSVRGRVASLQQTVSELWDAEGAAVKADKKAPKPLRAAFSRRYHMLRECMIQVRDGERAFNDNVEFLAFANDRDPALDHARVAKRLASIRQSIMDFYVDFPVDGLKDAAEFLADIGKSDLDKARKAKLAGELDSEPRDEPSDEPSDEIEPAVGVSELLDEALKDMGA